ncbi:MAG: bacteriophage abortive infection AbiH family protein [Streptococcaceae bacterium]|nr:bacteriophage abortive infection AbiH family protein [Streptococcaceae bacterium]
MTNKLIIIGNGFDLHHGLPTTFNEFVDSTFCSSEVTKGLLKMISGICSSKIVNWSNVETLYMSAENEIAYDYKNFDNDFSKSRAYNKTINQFENEFINYLRSVETRAISGEFPRYQKDSMIQKWICKADIILDFNYTNTLERLYQIPKKCKHIKIHGSLNDENILIGFSNTFSYNSSENLKGIQELQNPGENIKFHPIGNSAVETTEKWKGSKLWKRQELDFKNWGKKKGTEIGEQDIQDLWEWFTKTKTEEMSEEKPYRKNHGKYNRENKNSYFDALLGENPIFASCNDKEKPIDVTGDPEELMAPFTENVQEYLKEREYLPLLIDAGDIFESDIEIINIGHSLQCDADILDAIKQRLTENKKIENVYQFQRYEIDENIRQDNVALNQRAIDIFGITPIVERYFDEIAYKGGVADCSE